MNHRLFIASPLMLFGLLACTSAEKATGPIFSEIASAISPATNGYVESDMVEFLVERFGVDSNQAKGGLGVIFALAQQRMTPEEFMHLSSSVPDMAQYLAAVPQSSSSFHLGLATSAMDEKTLEPEGLSSLGTSFQALGMSPEMVFQFVPAVLQYFQQRSELTEMSLLENALY